MKHIPAILIKWLLVLAITSVTLLPVTEATLTDVLVLSAALTLTLYLAGDMMILPAWGNAAAVSADVGVAFIFAWFAPFSGITLTRALIVALAIGVAEHFYHQWLQRSVFPGSPADEIENRAP